MSSKLLDAILNNDWDKWHHQEKANEMHSDSPHRGNTDLSILKTEINIHSAMNGNRCGSKTRSDSGDKLAALCRQLDSVMKERDQWRTNYHNLAKIMSEAKEYHKEVIDRHEMMNSAGKGMVLGTESDVAPAKLKKMKNHSDADADIDLNLVFSANEPNRRSGRHRRKRPRYSENESNTEWWLWW